MSKSRGRRMLDMAIAMLHNEDQEDKENQMTQRPASRSKRCLFTSEQTNVQAGSSNIKSLITSDSVQEKRSTLHTSPEKVLTSTPTNTNDISNLKDSFFNPILVSNTAQEKRGTLRTSPGKVGNIEELPALDSSSINLLGEIMNISAKSPKNVLTSTPTNTSSISHLEEPFFSSMLGTPQVPVPILQTCTVPQEVQKQDDSFSFGLSLSGVSDFLDNNGSSSLRNISSGHLSEFFNEHIFPAKKQKVSRDEELSSDQNEFKGSPLEEPMPVDSEDYARPASESLVELDPVRMLLPPSPFKEALINSNPDASATPYNQSDLVPADDWPSPFDLSEEQKVIETSEADVIQRLEQDRVQPSASEQLQNSSPEQDQNSSPEQAQPSAPERVQASAPEQVEQNQRPNNGDEFNKVKKREPKGKTKKQLKQEAKVQRDLGKAYVSFSTKKMVPEKNVKSVDCSKCRRKCTDMVSKEQRIDVNCSYWSTGKYERHTDFILSTVLSNPVMFRRPKRKNSTDTDSTEEENRDNQPPKRKVTYEYTLKVVDKNSGLEKRITVCKQFYLATLSISESVVRTAKKNEEDGHGKEDGRGRHTPAHALKPEVKAAIYTHIESFPVMASHYARKKTTRQYLASTLNVQKMYDLYVEDVVSKDSTMKVSISTYRHIFNAEYKLSFHRPKKDMCLLCFKHLHADEETKAAMGQEMRIHLENKELSRLEKENDKKRATVDSEFKTYTFDLEAVLYSPCSDVSSYHYSRKFCSYNFTIYDQDNGDGTCYLWHETEGKRGSDEIGTCLWMHLTSLPPQVKHVSFYSDSCGGQNRNRYVASLLEFAVKNIDQLETVEMNFLEKGHTDMECDSMHSTIEKAKKNHPVYCPAEWATILRGARRKRPYSIVELTHENFFDLKDLKEKTIAGQMSKDSEGKSVSWMEIKRLKFCKQQNYIEIKTGYAEETYRVLPIQEPCRRRGKQQQASRRLYELKNKYSSKLPISSAKKKDILSLCSTGAIPSNYHAFWTNISSSDRIVERLAEPDVDDGSLTDDEE